MTIIRRAAITVAGVIMATMGVGVVSGPAFAGTSSAESVPVVITVSLPSGNSMMTSTLKVTFSSGSQSALKKAIENKVRTSSVKPSLTIPPPGGGGYSDLHCNQAYSVSDSDGTFTYQHSCTGTTSAWGYKLSVAVQAITVSDVDEYGMVWDRNGTSMPDQADHLEPASYQFHGTFNPVHNGDDIVYVDQFTFTIDVDGDTGSADLIINGAIHQLSTS